MKSYKYKDSNNRVGKYRKDLSAEQFFDNFNDTLAELEPEGLLDPHRRHAVVFVLGLHRSGTTLATQIMAQCQDVGCVNNLIARFWLAPVTGIRLSRQVLGDRREISFESDFGKTRGIGEPHEFSYFWHHWFQMGNMPPYDRLAAAERIDWSGFATTIRNMAAAWERPLMLKAPDVGFHLPKVAEALPEALFVLTERPLADVGCSIRRGRIAYFDDEDCWIGSYPDEWELIRHLPGKEQIAWQIVSLSRMFREGLAHLPETRRLIVPLADMCLNPDAMLDSVDERIRAMGYAPPRRLAGANKGQLKYSSLENTPEHVEFARLIDRVNAQILSEG